MSIEDHIIADKTFRRDIDAIIQRLKSASGDLKWETEDGSTHRQSEERREARKNLQLAVMWLGMDLKAINEEQPGAVDNPYPNSKDPGNTKIDPTADGLKL